MGTRAVLVALAVAGLAFDPGTADAQTTPTGWSAPATSVPVYVSTPAPEPPPRPRYRRDWALTGSGIGLFVGGWLGTWLITATWYSQETHCVPTGILMHSCVHDAFGDAALGWSFLPLLGPWLMMTDSVMTGATYVFPVIAGLVQDVGFVMMLVGLLVPTDDDPGRIGTLHVRPLATPSLLGVGIDGTF